MATTKPHAGGVMGGTPVAPFASAAADERRVRIALLLHAAACALLFFGRSPMMLALFALLLAASAAMLGRSLLKIVVALVIGAGTAATLSSLEQRVLGDFGHVLVLLAAALPACVDAAGTSFRDGRSRWLWLRGLLLLLTAVIALGVWPAPKPSSLVPVLIASHVVLRLGVQPVGRAPLSLRGLISFAIAVVALLALARVSDLRALPSDFGGAPPRDALAFLVPRAPYASLALCAAFIAACLRVTPRLGIDGILVALPAVAVALEVDLRDWWTDQLFFAIVTCFVAATTAHRHIALRSTAAAIALAAIWLSEKGGMWREGAPFAIVVVILLGFASAAAAVGGQRAASLPRLPTMPTSRPLDVDPQFARLGAALHMAGLGVTMFVPSASLLALVPAVVFATRPLARVLTVAAVTLAWAAAHPLAPRLVDKDQLELAFHAWFPWIALALAEAVRSRGNPKVLPRAGATLAAFFLSIIAFSADAPLLVALLPGAVLVQAALEFAAGTTRPLPRIEQLAVVIAVPVLAGLAVFEFVMRWLVSSEGWYADWDLHPITLFLIDGVPAVICVWLVAHAGLRRALPPLAPGGAMLAAVGVLVLAHEHGHHYEIAAIAVGLYCVGAVTRPGLARLAGVWCALLAFIVAMLRTQLPRPEIVTEMGYPLWVILWFGALAIALVLSDAMRVAPLVAAAMGRGVPPAPRPAVGNG